MQIDPQPRKQGASIELGWWPPPGAGAHRRRLRASSAGRRWLGKWPFCGVGRLGREGLHRWGWPVPLPDLGRGGRSRGAARGLGPVSGLAAPRRRWGSAPSHRQGKSQWSY